MPDTIQNLSKNNRYRSCAGITFGDVTYGPKGQCGPRVQQDYQLVRLLSGSVELRIGEEWRTVPSGSMILCHPGRAELFLFSRDSPTQHQWCSVRPDWVHPPLARRLRGKDGVVTTSEAMHGLLEIGLTIGETGPAADTLCRTLALSVLEAYLAALEQETHPESRQPAALIKARALIRSRYGEKLSLSLLAREAGISSNHLIKLFRKHHGSTPAAYLWNLRLDHSAVLLKETGLSIAEIAYRVGFENPFHFTRRFRERFGTTPRDFRKVKT